VDIEQVLLWEQAEDKNWNELEHAEGPAKDRKIGSEGSGLSVVMGSGWLVAARAGHRRRLLGGFGRQYHRHRDVPQLRRRQLEDVNHTKCGSAHQLRGQELSQLCLEFDGICAPPRVGSGLSLGSSSMSPRLRMIAAFVVAALVAASCGGSDELNADAGSDFRVAVGEAPSFDGCGSSGDIVNYQWVLRSTPSNMTDDLDKPVREFDDSCSFTLDDTMLTEEVGMWEIELIVNDADGNTAVDSVSIEVFE